MVRVAVCDDNKVFLEMLRRMVGEKFEQCNVANRITDYMSGAVFLEHHKKDPFDIVFLDIIMPDMDGFEVAKEIRKISEKTYIVFVTTERSLVYDVFDFETFDFVPKDSPELLDGKLTRVIKRLSEHLSAYMKICLDISFGEKRYIEPCEIVSCRNVSEMQYSVCVYFFGGSVCCTGHKQIGIWHDNIFCFIAFIIYTNMDICTREKQA